MSDKTITDKIRKEYLEIIKADTLNKTDSIIEVHVDNIELFFELLDRPKHTFYNLKAKDLNAAFTKLMDSHQKTKVGQKLVIVDHILKFFEWCEEDDKLDESECRAIIRTIKDIKEEYKEELNSVKRLEKNKFQTLK